MRQPLSLGTVDHPDESLVPLLLRQEVEDVVADELLGLHVVLVVVPEEQHEVLRVRRRDDVVEQLLVAVREAAKRSSASNPTRPNQTFKRLAMGL